MIIRKPTDLRYSDVTPRAVYLNRRSFLAAGLAMPFLKGASKLDTVKSPLSTDERVTSFELVTHYNNYYEFGTGKDEPAENAPKKFHPPSPWTVSMEGEISKPRVMDLDAIMKLAPLEERIYRHRCVERWSIVVPWIGFSLSVLLKQFQPTAKAKYVAFQSFYDPKNMLSPAQAGIDLPYVEGLRMDEAMHPLTLLCVGMYGETLAPQDGAPIRIIVPWKYGYKSIKAIDKIRFVEKEPPTAWGRYSSNEYGFYSNVNPDVDHPRWSQAKERRLPDFASRPTLKFNGYTQVASLYEGMDLKKYH